MIKSCIRRDEKTQRELYLKYIKVLITILLFGQNIQAQDNSASLLGEGKSQFSVAILTNGVFKNPGLNFRYEKPIFFTIKETPKRKIRAFNMNGNLGFYWDPYTHVATYANAGILYRKTNRRNRQWMVGINPLGYMRTFTHETYEVDDQLNVARKRFAGKSYYAPELLFGTGKLKENRNRFFNVHFMFLYKYNSYTLPLIHFEFGYRF